jgi:hypothetical protein
MAASFIDPEMNHFISNPLPPATLTLDRKLLDGVIYCLDLDAWHNGRHRGDDLNCLEPVYDLFEQLNGKCDYPPCTTTRERNSPYKLAEMSADGYARGLKVCRQHAPSSDVAAPFASHCMNCKTRFVPTDLVLRTNLYQGAVGSTYLFVHASCTDQCKGCGHTWAKENGVSPLAAYRAEFVKPQCPRCSTRTL